MELTERSQLETNFIVWTPDTQLLEKKCCPVCSGASETILLELFAV